MVLVPKFPHERSVFRSTLAGVTPIHFPGGHDPFITQGFGGIPAAPPGVTMLPPPAPVVPPLPPTFTPPVPPSFPPVPVAPALPPCPPFALPPEPFAPPLLA